MFVKHKDPEYREIAEGILMKPLTYGEKTLLTEIKFSEGSSIDFHRHPHEQIGYLISGEFELTVEGQTFQVDPGDSWCIKGGREHKAVFHQEALAIEVFSPVREEYMPPD